MKERLNARPWLAVMILAWPFVLLTAELAWAKDPLFQVMGVMHVVRETPAPDFRLPTPEGKAIALTELRGQVVFLNFWATWCPPCRVEMPSMERLYREFKDQGLAILAIDIRESSKQVARFMKDFQLTFPALLDVDGNVANRYRVQGLPTTFVIDRSGQVVGAAVGPRNWASPEGKTLIRSILDGKG